jgi:chorismate lyase / 3-hydroxybenzoate synthase
MNMSENSTGIHCQYVCDEGASANQHLLAKILFDAHCDASADKNFISTGLPLLAGASNCEFISSVAQVRQRHSENFYCAETEAYILLAYWSSETAEGGLQNATESIYNKLLTEIQERGYPHLVRVWNYFADINRSEQDLERYRQFCIGRFNAFTTQGIAEEQFPSACALGHRGGDLLIYALASKVPAQHFENPQQASAYHYPAEYGPRSPSFARASLLELTGHAPILFVSGTASVVGFVTQHPDDLEKQIQVTVENLNCLLAHVAAEYSKNYNGVTANMVAEVIKIYVRNEADLPQIKHYISNAYPAAPAVYLAADICRADLLLEIDGIWKLMC